MSDMIKASSEERARLGAVWQPFRCHSRFDESLPIRAGFPFWSSLMRRHLACTSSPLWQIERACTSSRSAQVGRLTAPARLPAARALVEQIIGS